MLSSTNLLASTLKRSRDALRASGACCCRRYTGSTPTAARQTLSSGSNLVRPIGQPDATGLEDDFALYPGFFSSDESRQLLAGALWKLDRVDPVRKRRRRGPPGSSNSGAPPPSRDGVLQELFSGEYGFQEGHYDSVIHDYRETTISSLPPSASYPDMPALLDRAFALLPGQPRMYGDTLPPETISHLLHLAPSGRILPHVDNLEASGKVIMGVCLGSERILRLQRPGGGDGWEVLLQNGTVYLQKDKMRYEYEHSILGYEESEWEGRKLSPGHRLSFMIRDAPTRPPR